MTLEFAGGRADIFPPAGEAVRLALWVFAERDEAERLAGNLGGDAAVFAVSGEEWNRDLSPWAAPACFRGGGDFAGEGPAYLRRLDCRHKAGHQDGKERKQKKGFTDIMKKEL